MEFDKMTVREASQLSPLQLAYIGDSVWEIIVRSRLLHQKMNVYNMHIECVKTVNAAAQAKGLSYIHHIMTEDEKSIFLRGRNAHSHHPSPRNQNPADYAEATGFEALLGYLYLTGNFERLKEIEKIIFMEEK